jgi:hypothetical protein
VTTPTPEDLKRAEEIASKVLGSDCPACEIQQALSKERARTRQQCSDDEKSRTLNSEAVQGLIEAIDDSSSLLCEFKNYANNIDGMVDAQIRDNSKAIAKLNKLQQFKGGE